MNTLSLLDGRACKTCGLWKPLTSFKTQKKCAGGHEPRCRACSQNTEAKKRWDQIFYQRHREKRLQAVKEYAASRRDDKVQYLRDYYQINREELNAKGRESRLRQIAADPEGYYERQREQSQIYRQSHKEELAAAGHRARAKRKQAKGTWTAAEWRAVRDHYGNQCLRCGKTGRLHRDQVIPLAKGGSNDITNLQPLCHSCNSRKHVDTTDYRPDGGSWAKENLR